MLTGTTVAEDPTRRTARRPASANAARAQVRAAALTDVTPATNASDCGSDRCRQVPDLGPARSS